MARQEDAAVRGVVPSTYVRLLFEYLERQGHDPARVLGEAPPDAGDRGLGRYPVARWRALLERASAFLDDPRLGLHLGRSITPAHFGVMGYVLLACPNLGAAFARLMQFQRLVYDVNPMRYELEGDSVRLEWGVEHGRPGPLVDECAIAALVQFTREVTSERSAPSLVAFANPQPADLKPYRDWFGCPVRFGQPFTVVCFPSRLLNLPLRQPDARLLQVLEHQAEALLAELPPTDDFEQAVRRSVARLVREGEPSLERVADELHVSPRTLHRRLEQGGTTFRKLLDEIRRRLAENYLRDPRLRLAEIAGLLGYSEQSAFTRAFKLWTGIPPNRFRQTNETNGV